jgi:prevent-host-death family protein
MKQTTIRELKHQTSKVLSVVESGTTLEVCRRGRPVAVLSPPGRRAKVEKPDFAARLREIYGDRILGSTGTEVVAETRGER